MAELQGRAVTRSTADAGVEKLTIAANVASGSDQDCKRVLIIAPAGNTCPVYMQIGATADADDFLIPEEVVIEVFVTNTNKLHFYSGTNDDTVRLYWEN